MSLAYILSLAVLLCVLTLAAYVDRIYTEMGRFLARKYQENIDAWELEAEPKLRAGRESIALSASLLRQLTIAALALLFGFHLHIHELAQYRVLHAPTWVEVLRSVAELILLLLVCDRLVPQLLFTRTRGVWIGRLAPVLRILFLLVQPVALALTLLLSIAALAEPEVSAEDEHPSEAMEALLEAGEEEGILEESDRELVRSVVEFGDKMVREVMTPRPEVFAVPGRMTLEAFTAALEEHAFSRVPVYDGVLDEVTGIAFAHDLLQVPDTEAASRTVAAMQRPAAFVPETKNVAELLREMQREKQHMRLVIDEYGGVAGLVTIEDLLEAIVGEIHDEHDTPEDQDAAVITPEGDVIASGTFEIPRLRDVMLEQLREQDRAEDSLGAVSADEAENGVALANALSGANTAEEIRVEEQRADEREDRLQRLGDGYEATTVGGLVSEMSGHIPFPGEVVEQDGLRFEVLGATDRRIEQVRVSLVDGDDTRTPRAGALRERS